jgi:hypothetical protein
MAGKMLDTPYQYDPKTKRIERTVTKMKDFYDLSKGTGLADLMSDARSQMSQAASMIASDPKKAQEMLDQVSAAMSVAGDVNKADGAPAAAAPVAPVAPAPSADEIEKAKATPTTATGASTNGSTATTPPGSTGSSPSDDEEKKAVKKAIADLGASVATLTAMVEKMNVATAKTPNQGQAAGDPDIPGNPPKLGKADAPISTPVGDLAAQVPLQPDGEYAALEKALTTGDPRTQYLEGLKAVGGDPGALDSAVYELVKRRFHDSGVISADRVRVYTPQGLN